MSEADTDSDTGVQLSSSPPNSERLLDPMKGSREPDIEQSSFGRTPRTERKSVGNVILNGTLREKAKSIQPRKLQTSLLMLLAQGTYE